MTTERANCVRAFPAIADSEDNVATLQLYAIWVVLSIGAAGALLAWWIM